MGVQAAVLKRWRLAEVRVLADEAAFAEATRAAPVAVQGQARLALHVEVDVAAERRAWARRSPAWKAGSSRPTPSWATSFVARTGPWWFQERARLDDFTQALGRLRDQRARLASST